MPPIEPTYLVTEIANMITNFGKEEMQVLYWLVKEEKKRYTFLEWQAIDSLMEFQYGRLREERKK